MSCLAGFVWAFPYGEHISLVAKRFFPGTLDDIGHRFRDIAHRMVEVAICLDVTERSPDQQPSQPADALNENPALQDCKIDLISAYPALEDSTDFAFVFGFD